MLVVVVATGAVVVVLTVEVAVVTDRVSSDVMVFTLLLFTVGATAALLPTDIGDAGSVYTAEPLPPPRCREIPLDATDDAVPPVNSCWSSPFSDRTATPFNAVVL